MTQAPNFGVPRSGPVAPDVMAGRIDDNFDAQISSHSGATRPAYAVAGTLWLSTATAGLHKYYFYDGVNDQLFATIDTTTGSIQFGSAAGVKFLATQMLDDLDLNGFALKNAKSVNGGPFGGLHNLIINGSFRINQRSYAGAALAAGVYGYDRWKADTGGATYSVAAGVATISAGAIVQVVEGANIEVSGTHTLSWTGTATAQVNGSAVTNGGQATLTAGTNATVRFTGGTVSQVQLEFGSKATPFERRPIGLETSLCQRYYQRFTSLWIQGYNTTGLNIAQTLMRPAPMRVAPTNVLSNSGSISNISAINVIGSTANFAHVGATIVSTGNGNLSYDMTSDAEL